MSRDRFKGAPWFEKATKSSATVIGLGGIGSWLTLFLARIGLDLINIVDNDYVEIYNIGGQFFRKRNIGSYKTAAVMSNVYEYSGRSGRIIAHSNAFSDVPQYVSKSDIIFSAVDNMEARKQIFLAFLESEHSKVFIDGRLEPGHIVVYAVPSDDENRKERYLEGLVPDEKIPDLDCTFKQTSHSAAMIAGLMTSIFTNYLSDGEVPYKTEIYLPAMFFKTDE